MKLWAKGEEQTDRVLQATVGLYGVLQGIAGKTLQEIEGQKIEKLDASALGTPRPGVDNHNGCSMVPHH